MWRAGRKRYFILSLCLLCCLSSYAPVWSSVGADVPLQELSDQQLLEKLADNLLTLATLQDQQQTELETARTELQQAQEQSSRASTLSAEARQLSTEAKDLANQSKDSAAKASISLESYKEEMQRELDKMARQRTWLQVGIGACLVIAAGSLIWTAIATTGGM